MFTLYLKYKIMAHPYRKNPINHCGPNHKEEEQATPLNHCGSSMMHSEGWNKMRTHNSPNTIGNEAAFNKNKKLRNPLNACWKTGGPGDQGYVQRGMKKKGGRTVPNCVPKASVKK